MSLEIETKVEGAKETIGKIDGAKQYAKDSVSYAGMKKAKSIITEGSWPSLTKMAMKLRKRRNENDRPYSWYLKFFRFHNTKEKGKIGFMNKKGVTNSFFQEHLAKSEEGATTVVTPKMRRYLGARGTPIRSITKILRTPKRPILDPSTAYVEREGGKVFQEKFYERMQK